MDNDANKDGPPPPATTPIFYPRGDAEPPPPIIPDHQLLRCIGRGSYGRVWLAQNALGMYRAVKIVYRSSFKDNRPFDRELSGIQKFEPISRSHEGFVDILQTGINEPAGYFYYVMELGDDVATGQKIDPETYSPKTLGKEIFSHGTLPLPDCLQLGLALSHALAELHRHGLVHRDIKPSNIIFVNGIPKLADIGLVAEVNEARSYVGTEGFIPPEGPGSEQADVFSLGKVLYEACTGKDRQDFPELPTLLDEIEDADGFLELNEVVLQACEKDLKLRYHSAWDMHAHLLVLANGKSVKRLRALERRLAGLKRGALVAASALIILAAGFYPLFRERRIAADNRQREAGAAVAYGNQAMDSGDLLKALPFFAEAIRINEPGAGQESSGRLRFASVLAQCPKLTRLWFEAKPVRHCEFSPDGSKILVIEYYGKARLYDARTGQPWGHPFGQAEWLAEGAFSADGKLIVTASEDSTACVWNAESLELVRTFPHPKYVLSARFDRAGKRIVTACDDGCARVWNLETGGQEAIVKHADAVRYADFSHDGRLIVTCSDDNTAGLWNAKTGARWGNPLPHKAWVFHAAFSPDDKLVVTAGHDKKARVWEVNGTRRINPDLDHPDVVKSAEFSPDGRLIVTACWDGQVRLWSADTLAPLSPNPILPHGGRMDDVSISPDGRQIISCCTDGSMRIWDLAGSAVPPPPLRASFSADASRLFTVSSDRAEVSDSVSRKIICQVTNIILPLESIQLNHPGRFLLSVSSTGSDADNFNRTLQVWDAATGQSLGRLSISDFVDGASLSDDGKHVATFGGHSAQVWDVLSAKALTPPMQHAAPVRSAFFSPDGGRLATISGKEARVWNTATGELLFKPLEHPVNVYQAVFSPDGSRLASCGQTGDDAKCFARVWDARTGQPIGPELRHNDGVLFTAFSPDGQRLLTASEDYSAMVWEISTGKLIGKVLGHKDQVSGGAFDPKEPWVATSGKDRTARIWNFENGDPLTPPLPHLTNVKSVSFLPGGGRLATRDANNDARIWTLPSETRSIEELRALLQLLSGDAPHESLENLWRRLSAAYPAQFTVTPQEICAWHEFQAAESESEERWFTAKFHLLWLLELHPDDPALLKRLSFAGKNLATQQSQPAQ